MGDKAIEACCHALDSDIPLEGTVHLEPWNNTLESYWIDKEYGLESAEFCTISMNWKDYEIIIRKFDDKREDMISTVYPNDNTNALRICSLIDQSEASSFPDFDKHSQLNWLGFPCPCIFANWQLDEMNKQLQVMDK